MVYRSVAYPILETELLMLRLSLFSSAGQHTVNKKDITNIGELVNEFEDSWARIMDKGYQGSASHLRAVLQRRKTPSSNFPRDDTRRNDKITSDWAVLRIYLNVGYIVECYGIKILPERAALR